jgi:hypothetical protein
MSSRCGSSLGTRITLHLLVAIRREKKRQTQREREGGTKKGEEKASNALDPTSSDSKKK